MENNSLSKRKTRNDLILAAVIIVIAAACLLFLKATRESGNSISVKVDGNEIAAFSLSENIEYDIITGDKDENINTLVIKDGKAFIAEADCPDGICKKYKAVSFVGETIVCLPHRVVIEVTGDTPLEGIDIVA